AGLCATLLTFALSHLGATVLFALPDAWPALGGPWTLEALGYGVLSGVLLATAVLAVAPLSLLIEPHELLGALPSGLDRTGAALSASLNLVPAIARSVRATAEAQRLRGWRPGGPRSWGEVVVPVVLTSIEDSIQLAEAMEARGYASGRRTRYRAESWNAADLVVALSGVLALAIVVALRLSGVMPDWQPYPTLSLPGPPPLEVLPAVLLLLPLWRWRRSRSTS
ncbi:MAG: energy-coupling factor transporter transmembrane component T, partial [Candidatus Dormiibacterota bacterium]